MADVRLTATNPEDSSVVPVACNAKGELLLEEPTISSDDYVAKAGDTMTGNLHLGDKITLDASNGSASFAGSNTEIFAGGHLSVKTTAANSATAIIIAKANDKEKFRVDVSGNAQFAGNGTSASPKITFNADGSAGFGNTTYSDNDAKGVAINDGPSYGGITIYNPSTVSAGSRSFRILTANNNKPAAFIQADGNASFAGNLDARSAVDINKGGSKDGGLSSLVVWNNNGLTDAVNIMSDGKATFSGDVIIGSRSKQWMIVESNGLAHLVEQTRAAGVETADLVNGPGKEPSYPPLRDIPGELTMVEQQLQAVLEKLRMIPEAGWEVWDGSD